MLSSFLLLPTTFFIFGYAFLESVKLCCVLFGFIGKLCVPVSNIHPLTFTMKMAQYLKIDGSGGKLLATYCENLSLSPRTT